MRVEISRVERRAAREEFTRTLMNEVRDVFAQQAASIADLAGRVDDSYARAVELLRATPGHVVVSGIGKSGLVGRKIAATFASTGTPSFFVHPAEAYHGDLGMITERDSAVLISYSGETEEVIRLLPHLDKLGAPVIALVGEPDSTLGRFAHVTLDVSVSREACPNNLAPTNSTLAAMAMGDALAVSLIRSRDFGAQDFARFHPGGNLGRRLLMKVRDVMHRDLPIAPPTLSVRESLFTITRGRLGLVLVTEEDKLLGIVTDGDLRRAMQRYENVLEIPVSEIMSPRPVCVTEDTLVGDAEDLMRTHKLKALVVVGGDGRASGVLEIFDR